MTVFSAGISQELKSDTVNQVTLGHTSPRLLGTLPGLRKDEILRAEEIT